MTYQNTYDLVPKNTIKFYCKLCDYSTCRKSQHDRHLSTLKHKDRLNTYPERSLVPHGCSCGKIYKHSQSLYNHKKTCNYKEEIIEKENEEINKNTENIIINNSDNINLKTMFLQIIEENKELRKTITDLVPKIGNNNNNTNNVKNKFNIQIFLNEKCKNALSIDEFIDKIDISMKNLLTTKEQGLGIGLSNIIIDNMNKLSLYERPMHCTDKKRETIYIKNAVWKKDEDKKIVTDILKRIENKQIKSIQKWTDEHPNFLEDEKLQEEYMNLIRGCTSSIEECKGKAIKKVCENIYITD
jgi:hypothetical protein